jgi:hypothetical protein
VAGLPREVPGDEMLPCDEERELLGALIVIFTSTETCRTSTCLLRSAAGCLPFPVKAGLDIL